MIHYTPSGPNMINLGKIKANIYLVSDVDKARELEAYIVSTKDGMEVFGLIGCDELEELTDAQRAFVQSDEAMSFKSN